MVDGFAPLEPAQIVELSAFDTPTVANAMELLMPWDRHTGLMSPRIHTIFPEMRPLVGYARTLLFSTRHPPHGKLYADWHDYWRYVMDGPKPGVTVGCDLDTAPAFGSLWGEVQANIHLALGCAGAVLEGAVRDLDGMRNLGYPCFAREVVVGHGYAHLVEFGQPVEVGDVLVRPGDLIHADKHGVLVLPPEVAPHLADACRKIIELERPLIATCQDREHFTIERLTQAFDRFSEGYPVQGGPTA